ncbi:MAG: FAD-dependent oxidoreductase, partial [Candidatus Omnitrophica bacterium]|nr:FAD-dependent oxidoreductase [Candidatus Omnitrophota bacterium]
MYELIIVGAGPAGLTAGLYAGRYGLSTLILEKAVVGGQIILSEKIENFPGFPAGIETNALIEKMRKQVENVGVKILMQEVVKIEFDNTLKKVFSPEEVFFAKAVIVASGASARNLGVKGEDKFIGRGISYCATCDGPLFKNKEICVVGGGDRALEEAIFLSRYAKKVYIIHRRSEFRGSHILEEEAKRSKKINFVLDSVVEEIMG